MIVFVHGNPETAALWDGVRAAIDRPSVALAQPGFGSPRPDTFGATKDDYVDWVLEALDAHDEPVHLVGHDWGAALTYRIAMQDTGRLRSWAGDVANLLHPDYVWHDFAQIWQTPGAGEQYFADVLAAGAEAMAPAYEGFGVPHDEAVRMAGWMDETMGRSVLDLYRSATPNLHADWGADMGPTVAPGLVVHATEDPFSDAAQAEEMAAVLGARVSVLEGLGHWWALQDPTAGAAVLSDFWDSL